MTQLPHHAVDGEDLEQLVLDTRRQVRKLSVVTGVAVAVIGVLGWLTLAVVVDMLFPLPVVLRLIAATGFWLILATGLFGGIVWPALRRLNLDGVAYRIERTVPAMHNRLITVLDVRHRRIAVPEHDDFVDRLLDQTRSRLADYQVERVARRRPVKLAGVGAAAMVIVPLVLLAIFFDRMPTAMARVLRPTAAIAPVSWVKLLAVTGDCQVLEGDSVEIIGDVARGQADALTCSISAAGGRWHTYPMHRDEQGRFVYRIAQVHESYRYRIRGGGTWTPTHAINMVGRPIVEQRRAAVRLPDYTRLAQPQPVNAGARQISALAGSTIDIEATVSGAASGDIELYELVDGDGPQQVEREVVWFDDDLPPDAMAQSQWRWVNEPIFSGLRAHTFDWSREGYGFATRLNKLSVTRDAAFFVYVHLDDRDPPSMLTVTLHAGDQQHALTWRSEASDGDVGALPATGKWVRLEAPASRFIPEGQNEPASLSGMTFEIDAGRIFFDRAGVLTRAEQANQNRKLERTETIPMTRGGTTDTWVGAFGVDRDCLYSVKFVNELGHANAAIKPVPVVATTDQPPTVLIEKPGHDLLLDDPVGVPLMARALDDYGVQSVAIQFSRAGQPADKFGDPQPLTDGEFDEPDINRLVLAAIDTKAHKIEPGQSIHWRLIARDFKGQTGHSQAMQIALAAPEQRSSDQIARRPKALSGLLDGLADLLSVQGSILGEAGDLLANLLPAAPPNVEPVGTVTFVNPDGTPMTAEQVRQHLAKANETLTDEQRQQLAALNERLMQQHEMFRNLSQRFDDAIGDSAMSPLTLPQETMMLRQMALSAREQAELARRWQDAQQDAQMLAEIDQMMPQMNRLMEDLQSQITQMEQSRQALAQDPLAAHEQMMSLMAMMEGQGSLHMLGGLDQSIEDQRDAMAALQEQLEELTQKVQAAAPDEMNELSNLQQELDAEALEQMKKSLAMMRELVENPGDATEMFAPWAPPRFDRGRMPVEQDTPEPPEENPADPQDKSPRRTGDDADEQDDANWWDQRADFSQQMQSWTQMDERFSNRQRPVNTANGQRRDRDMMMSPREMLRAHQDALNQRLTQNSNDLAGAQQQMGQMSQQMQSLMSALRSGDTAGLSQQQLAAMAQMRRMRTSPQMQRMSAMARRTAMMMMSRPRFGSSGSYWQMTNLALPGDDGDFMSSMSGSGANLTGQQRAAYYRLPPKLRQPLMQGMRERGPEGYQHLIDAYYQDLAQQARDIE